MWHHEFTFKDYNGNERKETHYFGFNPAEMLDLEFRTPGGLEQYLKDIVNTLNGQKLADTFKMLIEKSYGIKDPEGRRFMKSPEITRSFVETEAYSQLYMGLVTDSKMAADFFNGIFPKEQIEQAVKMKEAGMRPVEEPKQEVPPQAPSAIPMPEGYTPMAQPVQAPVANVTPMPQQPIQ